MKSRVARLGILLLCANLSACQEAEMGGTNGKKKKSDDATGEGSEPGGPGGEDDQTDQDQKNKDLPIGTPETGTLEETGWVGEDVQEDYDNVFGSDGNPDIGDDDDSGNGNPGLGEDGDNSEGDKLIDDADAVFWMACSKKDLAKTYKFDARAGTKIRLAGEFCPERPVTDKLTILFVVDFSGSMSGSVGEGPNDPTVAGSCGRLQAAQALIEKYTGKEFEGIAIDVGMVAFADNANLKIPVTPARDMKQHMNEKTWCGSNGPTARTNYSAAFSQAETALAGIDGDKAVFFISDGSPTVGGVGGDHKSAGMTAAQSLRTNIRDMVLNIVFVGYKNGQAQNPQTYLEEVAGNKDRVKVVASADQMAEAVQSIGVGKLNMSKSDVKASLEVEGKSSSLTIDRFVKNPKRTNRWAWTTGLFELKGEAGRTVDNVVLVKGETADGIRLESEATIRFKLHP